MRPDITVAVDEGGRHLGASYLSFYVIHAVILVTVEEGVHLLDSCVIAAVPVS